MTHTLILGGAGFIGSHLTHGLLAQGQNNFRVFDRIAPEGLPKSVQIRQGDFLHREDLLGALEGCHTVYHLISMTVPASSNADPYYDAQGNILGTINLLEACVEARVKRVIFISSGGTIYGVTGSAPVTEEHPTDPISAYGIGKLAIEKYLHLYHHMHGLDYCILRVANPYGAGQKGANGQGVIGAFLHRIASGEPIEIWGDGKVVRDYIYIDDVVSALIAAGNYQGRQKLFNIGSGQGHSVNEIIDTIETRLGVTVTKNYKPGRAVDVPVNVLDITRATKELGWSPKVNLEAGIGLMVEGKRKVG
jgi:UDP-glucose 4-epimerase